MTGSEAISDALARGLGVEDVVAGVKVPRHRAGPPETLTDLEYANVLRVLDRRAQGGRRDYALLRVMGDCGLRSAELRGLEARDVRSPRSNSPSRPLLRSREGRHRT